jgi:hypothetical protein
MLKLARVVLPLIEKWLAIPWPTSEDATAGKQDAVLDVIYRECLWAMSYLECGGHGPAIMDYVLSNSTVMLRVVSFLMFPSSKDVRLAALRCIGNLSSSIDRHTEYVIEPLKTLNVFHCIFKEDETCKNMSDNIRKELMWTLSNVTASNSANTQKVIDAQLIPYTIATLNSSSSIVVRREAAWALANSICASNSNQVKYFANIGCVQLCARYVQLQIQQQITNLMIESLHHILRMDNDENQYTWLAKNVLDMDTLLHIAAESKIEGITYNARAIAKLYTKNLQLPFMKQRLVANQRKKLYTDVVFIYPSDDALTHIMQSLVKTALSEV